MRKYSKFIQIWALFLSEQLFLKSARTKPLEVIGRPLLPSIDCVGDCKTDT